MTAILDTIIGTTFVFLLFSLVVTALSELIANRLDRRAAFLKKSLEELLNTASTKEGETSPLTVTTLLQHGLITSLSKGPYKEGNRSSGVPSYIPANLFSSAVVSLLKGETKKDLLAGIKDIPQGSRLRSSMEALYDEVEGDVTLFRKRVEAWFDEAMVRTSGWYKRNAQFWMFWIALGLAVFANVDAIQIVKEISANGALRTALVTQAKEQVKAVPGDLLVSMNKQDAFKETQKELRATGIPMGWESEGKGLAAFFKEFFETVPTALLGWFMTACAASMGAPFWFDTLSRIINIRSAGKAPEKASERAEK